MQRKSKYLWAALAASLCLIMALLVMLGMSLRRQPLTGTYLCEGLSPGAGTYLVFDEKGTTPCTGSPACCPPGRMQRTPTASMC